LLVLIPAVALFALGLIALLRKQLPTPPAVTVGGQGAEA
jgi:hypothetical protein